MARRAIQQLDRELIEPGKEFKRQSLRALFLFGIQQMFPDFWQTLNEAWLQHGARDALKHWPPLIGGYVRDEWFFQVILDTLQFWAAHPDSAEARLDGDGAWFRFQPSCPIPDLTPPTATRAVARGIATDLLAPEAVLDQMDVEYLRHRASAAAFLRDLTSNPASRATDAQFTILKWAGLSVGEIRNRWIRDFKRRAPKANFNVRRPEKVIQDAVKRFSDDIGLHLPKKWSRDKPWRIPNS